MQGLKKQCKEYEEWDDNYRQLMKLSDVTGVQPEGFLLRFPFYVIAERDAHIVFSESQNPDWFVDDVYEFGKYIVYISIFVVAVYFSIILSFIFLLLLLGLLKQIVLSSIFDILVAQKIRIYLFFSFLTDLDSED